MKWIYGINWEAINKKMLSESKKLTNRIHRRSAILNLIKLNFFMVYSYLKLNILFNSKGLAIWSGFSDNTHIKKIMVDIRPFWPS